jgi:hypothetical protein
MYELLASENPVTVRQVFYRLVSRGIVARTESEYRSTVARLLAAMRREGAIPYRWIADNTRWMRKSQSYACLEDALYRPFLRTFCAHLSRKPSCATLTMTRSTCCAPRKQASGSCCTR